MLKEVPNNMYKNFENEVQVSTKAGQKGHQFLYWENLAKEFSEHTNGDGYSNAAYPIFIPRRDKLPMFDFAVIVGNFKDAKRLAETHVKKSELYKTTFLADGVLGTNNNESWKVQREQLTDAFLPNIILKRIFNISLKRAEFSINDKLLKDLDNNNEIDLNEFFLYEAMAQLQLALLGENEYKMKDWNCHIRQMFNKSVIPRNKDLNGDYIQGEDISTVLRRRKHAMRSIKSFANEVLVRGEENVKIGKSGPVMENVVNMCPFKDEKFAKRDTINTFLFAGHDTTANLMTHFIYEISKNKNKIWLKKIQNELDFMFENAKKQQRKINYDDLKQLNIMKICLNETLRLWPSVPNGTFREFEFDDYIQGYNNNKVKITKGTQMVIPVWLLHRNPTLWERPDEFFPNRNWLPEEDWNGEGLKGTNPASHRFCPFTFRPRDCMGRNFAQMEARVILACLLRKYDVFPTKQTKDTNLLDLTANFGTLGAKNGLYFKLKKRREELY